MNLLERDTVINALQRSLSNASFGLSNFPDLLKAILREDAWEERQLHQNGEIVPFRSFAEFVQAPLIRGLGSSVDQIKRLCSDDPEAIDLIDRAMQQKRGKRAKVDIRNNITNKTSGLGTSAEGAIRRLRKDRPDLHQQVLEKKLSPHAAMLAAGFRKPTATVRLEPEAFAQVAGKQFSKKQLRTLIELLGEYL